MGKFIDGLKWASDLWGSPDREQTVDNLNVMVRKRFLGIEFALSAIWGATGVLGPDFLLENKSQYRVAWIPGQNNADKSHCS